MAKMYDSGQEESSHRGNDHPGLKKSYHMELADQMDAQAGGFAWPRFMRTAKGAVITVVVVLILMTLMVMFNATFR